MSDLIPDHNFRKKHKNAMVDLVRQYEMNPMEFDWADVLPVSDGRFGFMVGHRSTAFAFFATWYGAFSEHGEVLVSYAPHPDVRSKETTVPEWRGVLRHFGNWLTAISEEEAPDEWEEIRSRKALDSILIAEYESELSPQDGKRVAVSLDEAREEIVQKRLLTPEQLASLSQELGKHKDSARNGIGRIQWTRTFVEGVVKWATARELDALTTSAISGVLSEHLRWITHQIGAAVGELLRHLGSGG
jgi:hypothetical protein